MGFALSASARVALISYKAIVISQSDGDWLLDLVDFYSEQDLVESCPIYGIQNDVLTTKKFINQDK